MTAFVLMSAIVLALTWLHGPVGGGFVWDALNGVGFVALGALGALHLVRLRPEANVGAPIRDRLHQHARLGNLALLLALAHAIGLTVFDPVLLEYLEPGAPAYMLAGLAAAIVLALVVWSARLPRRRRLFGSAQRFRGVHRALASVLLALTAWHVIGSGFYLDHAAQQLVLIAMLAACVLIPSHIARALGLVRLDSHQWRAPAFLMALLLLHATLRNL